jgi:hypothetical protein
MELLKLKEYQERSYEEKPSNGGWVQYGDDNLFPQYLIDLYKSSATHNALCTSIAYMIFGDGVQANTLDARLKIEEWGLQDEVRKACLDLKIQGGFALEVVYSIDRTTVAKVRHCPFENIRSGEVDENEEVQFFYYSKDWNNKQIEPELVRAFDPQDAVEYPVQILYVKPFSPGSYYYPKPDYIGSIDYIELDKEIGKYHINNIKNGLAPSFSIHFKNGVPSQEERFKIRNDIERQLAGATNAGKFIVTYSDSPDRKPDFEPFPLSDADKQYQFLSTEVSDKIMVGHRVVSSAMFGVKTAGQLGNTQELEIASELFDRQVIKPYQRIVKSALESIFNAAGTPTLVSVEEVPAMAPQTPSEEVNMSEALDLNLACDFLIEMGEELDDEWELIDARKVDYETEAQQDALWAFATVPSGKPQAKSEQDNDLIKVRYAYMPKKTGINGNESRDFCKRMVNAGERVWRKEDIEAASQRAVNPGWGPNGADTYDLFLYKGGGSCQHFWERRTYLRKNNRKVSVNRARQIIREAGLEPLEQNDPRVAKRTRDQVNRGFLEPKNWTTPR